MAQTRIYGKGSRLIFRALAVASLVAAFAQVTLGGIVRVTGAGDGCGVDWPKCHGQWIPVFNFETLLEYSHRLSATVLGLLVIAIAILVLIRYRRNRWALASILAAFSLVLIAAELGRRVVDTGLEWQWRLLHLGIAEGVVAALVITVIVSWRVGLTQVSPDAAVGAGRGKLVVAALIGVFLLILSGSYIVGMGYGSSCGTWPLCNGSIFPEGRPYIEHMSHRYFAAIVGLLVLAVAYRAWQDRIQLASLGRSGALLFVAFAAQILVGALTVWLGFTPEIKAIHLSMATLVWIALVFAAALSYVPQRFNDTATETENDDMMVADGLTERA